MPKRNVMKESEENIKEGLVQIDLRRILRERVPASARKWIPGMFAGALERLIHQEELNAVLREAYPAEGWRFSEASLKHFNIALEVEGEENIPDAGRWVFAGNHPLGGLDGISLIKVLGERYGDSNVRFLVNDMLMNVVPLRNVFLPVNKYGSQGRGAASAVDAAYRSDAQIVVFPAGLVSRKGDDGSIRDLRWHKMFAGKALESGRGIVPVYFDGLNSPRFYNIARWRGKLGIKVNLEQALLPSEVCRSRGKRFRIVFGKPMDFEALSALRLAPAGIAAMIREKVYSLAER